MVSFDPAGTSHRKIAVTAVSAVHHPAARRVISVALLVALLLVIAFGRPSGGPEPATAQTATGTHAYLRIVDELGARFLGTATSPAYLDQIEPLEWSFGVENPTALGTGGTGKANPRGLTFKHRPSPAWTRLFGALNRGATLREAVLRLVRTTEKGSVEYLIYRLAPAFVTKIDEGSIGGEPIQTVTLDYNTLHETNRYTQPNGNVVTTVSGWDYLNNGAIK